MKLHQRIIDGLLRIVTAPWFLLRACARVVRSEQDKSGWFKQLQGRACQPAGKRKVIAIFQSNDVPIEDILPHIRASTNAQTIVIDGIPVKSSMPVLRVGRRSNNFACISCGVVAKYVHAYAKNKKRRPYGAVIGVRDDGSIVRMTVDHIVPKSKGGRNTIENLTVMCSTCNSRKGVRSLEEFLECRDAPELVVS